LKFKRNKSEKRSISNENKSENAGNYGSNQNDNKENFNFLNEQALASLDPEILKLCQELEGLGGGIKTCIESIKTDVLNFEDLINADFQKVVNGQEPLPDLLDHTVITK